MYLALGNQAQSKDGPTWFSTSREEEVVEVEVENKCYFLTKKDQWPNVESSSVKQSQRKEKKRETLEKKLAKREQR